MVVCRSHCLNSSRKLFVRTKLKASVLWELWPSIGVISWEFGFCFLYFISFVILTFIYYYYYYILSTKTRRILVHQKCQNGGGGVRIGASASDFAALSSLIKLTQNKGSYHAGAEGVVCRPRPFAADRGRVSGSSRGVLYGRRGASQ